MGKNEVAREFEPDEYGVREMDSMIGLSFQVPDDQDEAPGAGAGALLKAILPSLDVPTKARCAGGAGGAGGGGGTAH